MDLKFKSFYNSLPREDLVPLFAGLMPKLHKVGTYDWVSKFEKNAIELSKYDDSLKIMTCLTKYSDHFERLSDSSYRKHFDELYYPNQYGNGVFYDLRTMAVVNQAENFTEAKEFIGYYMEPENNAHLNEEIHSISILGDSPLRLNRVAPDKLLQYYVLVERMLTKLGGD